MTPGARISFNVRGSVRKGTLFFEYLRSYDAGMGHALVWLGTHRQHGVVLDARWRSGGSQVETAVLPLRSLLPAERCGAACNAVVPHVLHVQLNSAREGTAAAEAGHRSGLGKFKLTRIRTCENVTSGVPNR